MKKLIFLACVLFSFNASIVIAQTNVPGGLVSGTWTLAGSPYNVQGSVQIPNGSTLTIQAGVRVNLLGAFKLNVQGRLLALGTKTDSITFAVKDTLIGWKGIRFNETPLTNDTSKIFFCKLQYGKVTTSSWPEDGGGALCFNNFSKVIISNCLITNNVANQGGGIFCYNANPIIIYNNISHNNGGWNAGGVLLQNNDPGAYFANNTVSYNSSTHGGGVYSIGNNTIINNIISNNISATFGGGLFCSTGTVINNVITNNLAQNGGGIHFYPGNLTFMNNTISNNNATTGGGVDFEQGAKPVFRNCIITGNSASSSGSQVFLPDENDDPDFYFCNIQGGSADFGLNGNIYTGIYQNNIDADPFFVLPSGGSGSGFNGVSANWSLQNTSPCIDAGDPNGTYTATDIAGYPRVNVCRIDIGAYEYQKGIPFTGTIDILQPIHCNGSATGEIAVVAFGGIAPYSYLWSNGKTTANITGLVAGNYSVTVNESNGCTFTKSIILTNPIATSVNAGTDKSTICGEPIQLDSATTNYTGTGKLTYKWSPTIGLNDSTIANPIATVTSNITYSLTVTTPNGCMTSDNVELKVSPLTAYAGLDRTINSGDSIQLDSVTSNFRKKGILKYHWSPTAGLSNPTIANPIATPTKTTTYKVTVTTPNGCSATDSVTVNIIPFSIYGGENRTILCGDSVHLSISRCDCYFNGKQVKFNALWTSLSGNIKDTIYSNYVKPKATTTYTVTATTPNGCIASSSFTVYVNPITVYAGTQHTVTCGGTVELNPILTNYNGKLKYHWFPASGLNSDSIPNPKITVNQNTKYYITVTTSNGCSTLDSITVIVNALSADAGMDKYIVCGGNAQLDNVTSNYTGTEKLKYHWSPAIGLSNDTIPNPTATVTQNTKYQVTVSTPNGCSAIDSVTVFVNALSTDAGMDKYIVCGGTAQLDNVTSNYTGTGKLKYHWSPATGLSNDTIPNPTATVTQNTKYQVTVITPNGCSAMDSVRVIVNPLLVDAGLDKTTICGGSANLFVTTNYTGIDTLTYSWFPTTGISNPNIANPVVTTSVNQTYTVTVRSPNGCIATDNVNVSLIPMDQPEICIVGVDETSKNMIVWNKPLTTAIDSFYVFRETNITNLYQKIASVSYDSLSVFVDKNSYPNVQSNKYKISIFDKCGFESPQSNSHKTMHLTINQGMGSSWNLIWDQYVGFAVSTYNIYRGTTPNNLTQIGTTSGSNSLYSDFSAPSGYLYYQVEVVGSNYCNPTKSSIGSYSQKVGNNNSGSLKSYSTSRSNVATNNPTGIAEYSASSNLYSIYPNPAKNTINIEQKEETSGTTFVSIFDMQGKEIIYDSFINQNTMKLDVSSLSKDIYFIKVINAKNVAVMKFIKE